MSYILEALKKSQQERDFGQVPTLETLPTLSEADASGINYWGIAAVVLAGLAVVIALYAALRGAQDIPESSVPLPAQVASDRQMTPELAVMPEPSPVKLTREDPTEASAPAGRDLIDPEDLRAEASPEEAAVSARPDPPAAPEPAPAQEPSRPASVSKDPEVPEDLRRDIEAFKEEVRRTQGGDPVPKRKERPQDLRLPKEVKERLPGYLMTVHIYDADPAKRFVLINARKLREGDRTRDDIVVEEILPDGAVLSWETHRFFQHR